MGVRLWVEAWHGNNTLTSLHQVCSTSSVWPTAPLACFRTANSFFFAHYWAIMGPRPRPSSLHPLSISSVLPSLLSLTVIPGKGQALFSSSTLGFVTQTKYLITTTMRKYALVLLLVSVLRLQDLISRSRMLGLLSSGWTKLVRAA